MEENIALELNSLHFSIGGSSILNGISFKVRKGETLGIIGPNGSGKTTLFNCLSGFHFPSAGKIFFGDREVTDLNPHLRAMLGIGRVFQNFGIFKEMTVAENILTALESRARKCKNFENNDKHGETISYLKMAGLDGKAKDKAGTLSGGQMRLLEMIRTLAFGADLFLLDEPTAGVSPKMKEQVAALIRTLQERVCTIMIIEHDINFIQKFCDRIVVLDLGKVVLDDTPEQVRQNPLLHQIYFGKDSNQVK